MSDAGRPYHHVLAGALLGAAAGDVLLALNPGLLTLAGSARLVVGGALLGAFAAAPLLLARRQADRPTRAFWAALGALLVGTAAVAEAQRTLYYAFLGNGTRRLLVAVTAVGLLGAVWAAWLARRRPAGRVALTPLAALLALLLAVPAWGQRKAGSSPLAMPEPLPRAGQRSVLVVALEGVSWELLSRLASDGTLPVTGRLLAEGAAGALGSLSPHDGAALWTTAATGKRPSRHGVVSAAVHRTPLGELRLLPRLFGLPPPGRLPFSQTVPAPPETRRSLFFWEILAARGHEVAVLGWPASGPARPGLVLWGTERLFGAAASPEDGLPLDAARRARLLRVAADRLDRPLARALLPPGLAAAAAADAAPLSGAALDLSVAGATLAAVPGGAGSVSALLLPGLSGPARRFGPSAEPNRYWGAPPRDADARVRALTAYYRFLDDTLGDLLEREGRDRTVCVFSPVGYGPPGHTRALLELISGHEPQASPEAARDGFLILWGSGIRSGVRLTSATVWDLAPTLLVLSGEPIARDMDGRVLGEAFDERFSETESVPVITTFEPGGPQ